MKFQTIIFDLDGTISDPFVGISRSINFALETLGFRPVEPERIRSLIGLPLVDMFEHLLGDLPAAQLQGLVDRYRERYADIGYSENVLYADMPHTIARLSEHGHRLGICTSKRSDYAKRIVDMFGLSSFFSFVDGGAGIEKRLQLEALVAGGLATGSAVMIGDRAIDVQAGKTNDMAAAGVLWGFGQRAELEDASPDYLFEAPGDILDALIR